MRIMILANTLDQHPTGLSGISGGDVRFMELAKHWVISGHEVHILTSPKGVSLCKKYGVGAVYHSFDVWSPKFLHNHVYAYLVVRQILRAVKSLLFEFNDGIVYTPSDFLCDTLPALYMKLKYGEHVKWVSIEHWIEDPPWRRPGVRLLPGISYFLTQRASVSLLKKSDMVLAISRHTERQAVRAGIPRGKVHTVYCGVDHDRIRAVAETSKIYDGCYLKRMRRFKGVFDAIHIWKKVCEELGNATLALAGLATEEDERQLKALIQEKHLANNIEYIGPIYDVDEKFRLLKMSRLLVHPSYEENWAIVIGEAMACGIPVVSYNLPVLDDIWKRGFIGVPPGDIDAFSKAVINLLRNPPYLASLSSEAFQFSQRYGWARIAKDEASLMESLIRR